MLGKAGRPWKQPGATVYRPEPVDTIEYDPKAMKVVDTATGEYLIMRPGSRGGPGQIAYGTLEEGQTISVGFTSNWYPDEEVLAFFVNTLRQRSNLSRQLSQAELSAAPVARMIVAYSDAVRGPDKVLSKVSRPQTIVVDNRPKTPTDVE